jgi:hypothetical protein
MALKFSRATSACNAMSLSASWPETGSIGNCPEIKMKPFAFIVWEYGPMAFGLQGVEMTSFNDLLLAKTLRCSDF